MTSVQMAPPTGDADKDCAALRAACAEAELVGASEIRLQSGCYNLGSWDGGMPAGAALIGAGPGLTFLGGLDRKPWLPPERWREDVQAE